ncbi:glyoxalase [Flavihumibacter sp. CACIAM 22H1]|uniref:glyoxalase n=1 Tax=Flavihumibacter sp. CACIAM 22H1 TaxID=1812911 RepID=UPI0007A846A8|nr:glyoxalase [Flavihumibacter sp. CACIAM 22H1]KYP15386.1 MAG: glyoxalase [Flavihumibacter sp. CACIAM 22H1]
MTTRATSIRPFIGSQNFDESRQFYRELGFEETLLEPGLSVIKFDSLAFYLQNAYVKDWVDNTMVFVEVEDVEDYYQYLAGLKLWENYPKAKLSPIRYNNWGDECFVHDPSGILWHFGTFKK